MEIIYKTLRYTYISAQTNIECQKKESKIGET